MARLQRVALPTQVFLTLYAFAWLYIEHLPLLGQAHPRQYLPLIPLLALVALGGYCAFELVWGVLTMGNASEAYVELQKDIADAKEDLRKKGIHVD